MLPRLSILVPALLFALLSPRPASAQVLGEDLGQMWLSFSPEQVTQTRVSNVGDTATFYLMISLDFGDEGQNASDGLVGWEAMVLLPPEITVNSRQVFGSPVGLCSDGSCDNFSLGYLSCQLAEGTPQVMVRYDVTVSSLPGPLEVSLAGADPSSTGDEPGWLQCVGSPPDYHQFEGGAAGVLVFDPFVPTRAGSWSSVKAAFD